jgi:hypothetical protein
MKVFLSWSGDRSRRIAQVFRDWLPSVIQQLEPWMSEEDIAKGSDGLMEIANQLDGSETGIVFLTPENLASTWIAYEAGALAARIGKPCVSPFLFMLTPEQVTGPLARLQSTRHTKEDLRRLIATLNGRLGEGKLTVERLDKAFDMCWKGLTSALDEIPKTHPAGDHAAPTRTSDEMLREILDIVRGIRRNAPIVTLTSTDPLGPDVRTGMIKHTPKNVLLGHKPIRPSDESSLKLNADIPTAPANWTLGDSDGGVRG